MKQITFFLTILFCFCTFYGNAQVAYDKTNFEAPLHIPLVLSGNFAELRANHFHSGLDIKTNGAEGYRIYAVDSGYISRISISHWGYGKAIYVDHPNGYTSVYAHLSRFPEKIETYLRKKQFEEETETITIYPDSTEINVSKGEIIAYSGNSGSSGGPHLHFEIRETKTEYPVNPLLFGFDIKDDIKPTISNIKVYPLTNGFVDGRNKPKLFPTSGAHGAYSLREGAVIEVDGEIGFGVHTIDKLNGAGNQCGIYTIELFKDDTLVFMLKMEKLNFYTTRYINTHMDYTEYNKLKRSIHKSFVEGNNKLAIYDSTYNKGKIQFTNSGNHNMKYIVKDVYGNTSELNFTVKSNPSMEKEVTTIEEVGDTIAYKNDVVIEKDNFKVYLPENSVYQDLKASYKEEGIGKSVANLHEFGNSEIPVQHYFVMKIKTQNIPKNMENKATVVEVSKDKRKVFAKGGEFKDGWIETKVRAFGDYTVKIDSIAPSITPVNISEGKNISSASNIQFKIFDNLSGIEDYDVYIDGKWMLANYVPKRGTLTLTFDNYNKVEAGNHKLKVVVKDERGNESFLQYTFVR